MTSPSPSPPRTTSPAGNNNHSPNNSIARDNLSVGALKEKWPQDCASIICIGRRTLLRYRITNRFQDGSPCPGLFEIVKVRTDSKADEYGWSSRQQTQEKRELERQKFYEDRTERMRIKRIQKKVEQEHKEQLKAEGKDPAVDDVDDDDDANLTGISDNTSDYENNEEVPQLVQTEVVASVSSTSLNPINPLPVFGSLHHFRVPLPSALSATDAPVEDEKDKKSKDKDTNTAAEQMAKKKKKSVVTIEEGENDTSNDKTEEGTTGENNKKAASNNSDEDEDNDDDDDEEDFIKQASLSEVAAAGGIDGIDHNVMKMMYKMLSKKKAMKKEPSELTESIMNPRHSSRDRVFAIANDGKSFAILSVSAPPLKSRKAQPIRVQFLGDGRKSIHHAGGETSADGANNNNNESSSQDQSAALIEEQLRLERERKEQELNQDPPLFLRRTGSFPFQVTAAAMFILSFTDMVGLSDAYRQVGAAAAPVVGPLPFPSDASMSRCMKELSRMSTMCLRQKHCCLCYSKETGNFVILEMTSLSSDDVSVAAQSAAASGNIGAGWTSVVWAGPLCRSSDFARGAGSSHRPYTTYRARFFCYSAESGMSQMETITIPCESLAPKNTGGSHTSSASGTFTSAPDQHNNNRLRSRRRSTITKLAPTESDSLLRASSLIATPFSISGQRMCIMIDVANDSAILPLDDFDGEQATLMSCSSASSTSRLTATMTTPWTRFYSVASRVSNEAWNKIEKRQDARSSSENNTPAESTNPAEESLRPPSPAALRKRRPTAVVAQAIMQEKVFSIPELEWSRFITIHERYTDGGNYDEVLSYSASRGCAWISRIVYEDRWHKKALQDRLIQDLELDEKEDEKIQEECADLIEKGMEMKQQEEHFASSFRDASRSGRRRKSSHRGGSGEVGADNGEPNTPLRRRSSARRRSSSRPRSSSANSRRNTEHGGTLNSKNNNNGEPVDGQELEHRPDAADNSNNNKNADKFGDDTNNNGRRHSSRQNRDRDLSSNSRRTSSASRQTLSPDERRRRGQQAAPPRGYRDRSPGGGSARNNNQHQRNPRGRHQSPSNFGRRNNNKDNYEDDDDYDDNYDNEDNDHQRRNSANNRRDYKSKPAWGAPPSSASLSRPGTRSHQQYSDENNNNSSERPGTSPHRSYAQRPGSSRISNRTNEDYGGWSRPQGGSSAFAPLLFPKSNNPDGLPPRPGTGSAQNRGAGFPRRPFSSSNHRPGSLPALADNDNDHQPQYQQYHDGGDFNHYQSSFGSGTYSSRPPSGARRQAVRDQAKAVAERIATKREATPLEDSQLRRSTAVVQSMGEIEKLGVGEEGSDETADLVKIIGFMKEHDSKAKDAPEEEDDDEDEEEDENGNKKPSKKDSLTSLRKKRATVDARVYARAQEMLESGEITDEWIAAAFRHINRTSGKAEDTRRSNAVFALNEEELPSMKFPIEDPENIVRRPEGRPGWSYVLSPHSGLPPKTTRQLRAEAKQRKRLAKTVEETEVDEDWIKKFFAPPDHRGNDVAKKLREQEKEWKAMQIQAKDKETGEPVKFTEEMLHRFAEHYPEMQKKALVNAEKTLDKEAAALQTQKTLEGTEYSDMVQRLGEEYVERKKHHRAKARKEVEKEMKGLFVPAIIHSRRAEPNVASPGPLDKERTKEMANRLSTDYMQKKKEHRQHLMEKLEEERYRFVDERTREMYRAQQEPLSPEVVKELGERLAVPVIRTPAPR